MTATRLLPRLRHLAGIAVPLAIVIGSFVAAVLATGSAGGSGPARPLVAAVPSAAKIHASAGARHHAARARPLPPSSLPIPPAARKLAASLPLAQAEEQLFLVGVNGTSSSESDPYSAATKHAWFGFALERGNFSYSSQLGSLAAGLKGIAAQTGPIPAVIAGAQTGGPGTAFPGLPPAAPAALAKGTPGAARTVAAAAGQQLAALGVTLVLGPWADLDVAGGPYTGRVLGADPHRVAALVAAEAHGYRAAKVATAVAHFPGAGSASDDPDTSSATVGESVSDLRARDLVPFAAVAGVTPVVQMSNAVYAGFDGVTPATVLPEAYRMLRGPVGFRGVALTADLGGTANVLNEGVGDAAVQALQAGADLLYIASPGQRDRALAGVQAAVAKKQLSGARIRASLARVLALKAQLGLALPSPS